MAETETPFTLLQDTVPSKRFQSCNFEIKRLHNAALIIGLNLDFERISNRKFNPIPVD